jgi:SulP family sulfate permease
MKATRSDAIVFVVTFLAALLVRLDFAIVLGAATSILLFIRKAAEPELVEYSFNAEGQLAEMEGHARQAGSEVSIVHVEGDLFFGAAELFRDQTRRMCSSPDLKVVVLKMRNAHNLDATSVLALEELATYMRSTGRHLLLSEARKDLIRVLINSGLIESIGRDNIFPDSVRNPTLSTAKALRRAKTFLDGEDARVSIFVEEKKKEQDSLERTGKEADKPKEVS